MSHSPYRTIAVAATFSPRFLRVLAEAGRIRERFGSELKIIFVGKKDAVTSRRFGEAIEKLHLPRDSSVHYEEGDPATAILRAAEKLKAELLVAGALEKEAVHRKFHLFRTFVDAGAWCRRTASACDGFRVAADLMREWNE